VEEKTVNIASRLMKYMAERDVTYDILVHRHTWTAGESAAAAHLPVDRVAKSVVLRDKNGYLMAVLPASRRLDMGKLQRELNRRLDLVDEEALAGLFGDCELGATPPIGRAYGLETVVDDALSIQPDVYFEAGDHEHLIHVDAETFGSLLGDARHGEFTRYA
jgi:Ala-tRNA(Pro) deacylase